MRTCPSCGAANPDAARFCVSCGSSLIAGCRQCGAELPEGARFCPACGAPVEPTEPPPTGAERKLVTVLFADLEGSTGLAERLDPERLRELLERYFAAMREQIEAEGGTVEKFIGDAVVAAFGVPVAHEDDPSRALRAALRMRRRLAELNPELRRAYGADLRLRIGVNTGEVLATVRPQPGEPMITGDTVSTTARLEELAERGGIVVAERTARAARAFAFRPLGDVELRGRSAGVAAVVLEGAEASTPDRGVPGLRAPMVGRDRELALLRSVFERAVEESRPALVTVYGDPGVGKSRLTREFAAGLGDRASVVRGRCLPYGDGVTFWPLAEMLKAEAGVLDTDPPDVALDRIRTYGSRLLSAAVTPDPGRTTAVLAFTLGIEDPAFASDRMQAKDVRTEVHAAWRSFFSALALERPVVVLVEDIHWADPELLDLLEDVADRAVGAVMFVCPSRPELTARRPNWGGGRRNHTGVTLDPLTLEEADRLVGLLLAVDDIPAAVRARMLSRAEGNPFFLEEIIRHLVDEGVIVHEGGRWRAATGIHDVEIPDTVQAVLAARMDLLAPQDKRVLQAAAVVGRVFWPGPVLELVGAADVQESLEVLETRDLIVSRLGSSIAGQPEFVFKHILTRDIAYESLPRRERPAAHAAVAAWLERTAGARARELTELLAYHYATAVAASAGEYDEELRTKAFDALIEASADARSKQVLKKAERFAEEALGIALGEAERALACETIGEAALAGYQGDLSWRYFREAAEIHASMSVGERAPIVAYLSGRAAETVIRWPGSMRTIPGPEEVERVLELGMTHLPDGDSEERARLQSLRAGWPFAFPSRVTTEEEGLAYERSGLEAADMALRLGRPDIASAAFDAAAGFALSRGRYERVLELEERRFELAPRLAAFEVGDLYAMLAWSNHELGRFRAALRHADEGLAQIAGRHASLDIHVQSWRAVLRFRLADWDGALAAFGNVRALLDDRGDDPPYFATHAFAAAGLIHERRGETVEADRLADVLLSLGAGFSTRLLGWLALLLVERNELDPARRLLEHLPDSWRVHAMSIYEARCELVAAASDWDRVPALVADVRTYSEESGSVVTAAFADRLEGRAALAAGDGERAATCLSRAADVFASLGAVYDAAVTGVDLGRAMISAGPDAEAESAVSAARATFQELRAVKAAERLREEAAG